jgi:ABC-2 type transport system permease protein
MIPFYTLLWKECRRFLNVKGQTIVAPVLSSFLYLLIFSHVLSEHVQVYPNISYTAFLIPGLVMMTLMQNAFANASSSLIQSKMTGNLVFVLLPPFSSISFFASYVVAAMLRGLLIAGMMLLLAVFFVDLSLFSVFWVVSFALMASCLLGSLGMLAGICSERFDHIALFQNFIIIPATFLSGVFYSIHSLPPFWYLLSRFNPFFYLLDGFRFGFFGKSDVSPWMSLSISSLATFLVVATVLILLGRGYKLRS